MTAVVLTDGEDDMNTYLVYAYYRGLQFRRSVETAATAEAAIEASRAGTDVPKGANWVAYPVNVEGQV